MNPMDILGGMLGKRKSGSSGGGGGLGGILLEKILKGGRGTSGRSSGRAESIPQRPPGSPQIRGSRDNEQFDSLEDLLRHSQHRHSTRRSAPSQRAPTPQHEPHIARRQTEFTAEYDGNPEPFNQKAELLIIAMINAAKSDGRIDDKEQNEIIEQLGDVSQDEIQFLRSEFAKPLDVREFAWSVPLGMEKQIYAVSLMAIDLDQNAEAQYLRDLAHGFRMTIDECNQIHREFNAPQLRA